jgi:Tol biopolymer transport system component
VGTPNEQIFQLPVDNRGREQGPVAEVPLTEGARYFSPSVSRNGRWMAYTEEGVGKHSIVVRDFASGTNKTVEEQLQTGYPAVSISPDGSKDRIQQVLLVQCIGRRLPVVPGQLDRW